MKLPRFGPIWNLKLYNCLAAALFFTPLLTAFVCLAYRDYTIFFVLMTTTVIAGLNWQTTIHVLTTYERWLRRNND